MTRVTRTETEIESREIERTYTEEVVEEEEIEVEYTKCNWCGQEFAEDEDVDFTEMVKNPRACTNIPQPTKNTFKPEPLRQSNLDNLLSVLEAYSVEDKTHEMKAIGSTEVHEGSYQELRKVHSTESALLADLCRLLGISTHDVLLGHEISGMQPQHKYEMEINTKIKGKTLHICEYCEDNLHFE